MTRELNYTSILNLPYEVIPKCFSLAMLEWKPDSKEDTFETQGSIATPVKVFLCEIHHLNSCTVKYILSDSSDGMLNTPIGPSGYDQCWRNRNIFQCDKFRVSLLLASPHLWPIKAVKGFHNLP
jgi:hypothetical protein